MPRDLHLRSATTGRFARVLTGVACDEIRAAAGPTASERILHAEAVDQKLRAIDDATAASICGGER
jgi:hypothetical protein